MLSKLFTSKLTLQTVLAVLIASLATAAIVSATTIGNNISTDGNLTVTGNTGIGTTSPAQKLSVNGKVYTTGGIQFPDGSLQTAAAASAASSLAGQVAFYNTDGSTVSGTSTLFIAPIGYVGIGTANPLFKFDVAGIAQIQDYFKTSFVVSTSTATSTFSGGLYGSLISAPYFHATSTTATSTFAGGAVFATGGGNGNVDIGSISSTNNPSLNIYGYNANAGNTQYGYLQTKTYTTDPLSVFTLAANTGYLRLMAVSTLGHIGLDIGDTANSGFVYRQTGGEPTIALRTTSGLTSGVEASLGASDSKIYLTVPTLLSLERNGGGTGIAFGIADTAKAFGQFNIGWDGAIGFGPGTATRDAYLTRLSANTLLISSDKTTTGVANFIITGKLGIGTSSPASLLHVSAGTNATTTVEFGAQAITSKTCFNVRDALGAATSFYFVGTTMVVEPNRCR